MTVKIIIEKNLSESPQSTVVSFLSKVVHATQSINETTTGIKNTADRQRKIIAITFIEYSLKNGVPGETTRNEFLLMCAIFVFGFVVISMAAICRKEHRDKKFYQDGADGKLRDGQLREYILLTREHKCEMDDCGIVLWKGEPAPLEVDHIDGNAENGLPENIRLICNNCHAMTPTFRAKNIGNGRQDRYKIGTGRKNQTSAIGM